MIGGAAPRWRAVVLVKPQFEAGRDQVRRGVVRDPEVRRRVLQDFANLRRRLAAAVLGVCDSLCRARPETASTSCISRRRSIRSQERATEVDVSKPRSQPPIVTAWRRRAWPSCTAGRSASAMRSDAAAAVAARCGVEVVDEHRPGRSGRGAGRRRHDAARAAAASSARGTPVPGRQLRPRRLPHQHRRDDLEAGLERAFAGEYEVLDLPTIVGCRAARAMTGSTTSC